MDFNEGMHAFQLRLDALGAHWGILAEEAFSLVFFIFSPLYFSLDGKGKGEGQKKRRKQKQEGGTQG